MIWVPVLLPPATMVVLLLLRRRRALLGPVAVLGVAATAAVALGLALAPTEAAFAWGAGIDLGVSVAGAGRIMVVLVPLVALLVIAFAAVSLKDDPALPRLLALMAAFVGAMELLVLASDFLTLLIAWELVGAASWSLIGHEWRDPDRPRSAKEAFVTTRVGDIGLYVAAGAGFAAAGSFSYSDLAGATDARWIGVAAAGVLIAAAAKSAQVPFSPWLFSAMAGPTPVSALLHSATMVAAGAYALIRLEPIFSRVGWFSPVVIGLGLVTALAGGAVALAQLDFKKALAGSTSAQYGLMLVAVGAGFTAAGMGQLTAHAFFKALLFLGAGVALHAGGTLDLRTLRLGSALPRVAMLFAIGAAALAALPPLGGGFTKEAVLAAAFESGVWVGAGTAGAGLLSALYAGRLHLLGFGPGAKTIPGNRPHRVEIIAMGTLALFSVALGWLWLPGGEDLLAEATFGEAATGAPWELWLSFGTIALAFFVVAILWRRNRLADLGLPDGLRRWIAGWWGLPAAAKALVVDPILALSRRSGSVDRSIVDGLVRGAAAVVLALSSAIRRTLEVFVDRVVHLVGGGTLGAADASRVVDDRAVDGAVEELAVGIGVGGEATRKLQTGMSYHYYTMLVIGLVLIIIAAIPWR